MTAKHLIIKGMVQGVFYRATAKEIADELKIKGWIKNNGNGDVEAVAIGEADAISQFIEWCKKGPSMAVVKQVIISSHAIEDLSDFTVIRN